MRRVKVRDLALSDRVIVEPEKGDRTDRVLEILRIRGGRFEVRYERKGTWHYGPEETVCVP